MPLPNAPENTPAPENNEVQSAVAQLGNDLFGAGDERDEAAASGATPGTTAPSPGSAPITPVSGTVAPEDFPLPKAWKKEKETLWQPLPREVKEYLVSREADMVKGLDQYSTSHKSWTSLLEPYQPLLQQYPDVNPVQLLQGLMNNHLAIVRSSPEQKKELAKKLLASYGIDLGLPSANPDPQNQPAQLPAEVQQALARVQGLEQNLQTMQRDQQARQIAEKTREIEAFAADPKNKYFEEVGDDILRLLKTGAAPDLPTAYETAIWANPAVRQKLLQEQLAQPKTTGKAATTNLEASGEGTLSKKKPQTMDDTINSIVAKYANTL